VDPNDDSIHRFVVHHYRYDPDRHERRHVVVAAFDTADDYEDCLTRADTELRERVARGERVDPAEHISGTEYEPGYRRRQANGRLLTRAIRHGVVPPHLDELELPSNVGIVSARRPTPWWSRLARWLRRTAS
jgi:hypothetical protein